MTKTGLFKNNPGWFQVHSFFKLFSFSIPITSIPCQIVECVFLQLLLSQKLHLYESVSRNTDLAILQIPIYMFILIHLVHINVQYALIAPSYISDQTRHVLVIVKLI